jgi:D-xylose transport system substrate-binding protein
MSRKLARLITISLMLVMVTSLFGVGSPATAQAKTIIGLSFSDYATERWPIENADMTKALQKMGYTVLSQEADHDVKLQNDQIDNMVALGAKALIVIAEDGASAATAVSAAVKKGVKVLSYDRLIKTTDISVYITFDNVEVGRQEALGVLNALGLKSATDTGKWTKDNPAKIFMMGGDPGDNNAVLLRQGQDEMTKPFRDAGVMKIVADQAAEKWDAAFAQKLMENVLTANKNLIDGVIASNDGTALGALQALRAQKLAGKVPISGQDATADGCNSIVKGELTSTVYKDNRLLSALAVDLIDKLLKGTPLPDAKTYSMATMTGDKAAKGEFQGVFLKVVQVTKDNVYDVVVKSGFQNYDDVYRDIPADQRPPKP